MSSGCRCSKPRSFSPLAATARNAPRTPSLRGSRRMARRPSRRRNAGGAANRARRRLRGGQRSSWPGGAAGAGAGCGARRYRRRTAGISAAEGDRAARSSPCRRRAGAGPDPARRAGAAAPPQRLFPAPTIAAALAGVLPPIAEILVDELWAVPELRAAFPDAAVRHAPEGEWPLDLDALVEAALAPSITLAQGASVHFVPTPAAVMIDVDSGSPETGSPARVALATNLAAAAAIARHIRLRNLAGGIVIDFVGVEQSGARGRLRAEIGRALADDTKAPP